MHKDNDNSLARPTSWIARTPFRNVATSQIFDRCFIRIFFGFYEYLMKSQSIFIDGAACWNNVVKTQPKE